MQNLRSAAPRNLTEAGLASAQIYARRDSDAARLAELLAEVDRRRAAILATFTNPVLYRDADGRECVREGA